MTSRILVSTLALLVTRDAMTILPVIVPAHELEVQKAVFGEDNVEVRDIKTEPTVVTVDDEGERIAKKYGAEAVEAAFGVNFKSKVAKACESFKVGDAPDEVDAGLGGFDGTGEQAAGPVLAKMSKPQLLDHAAAQGVTVDPAATKAKIIEAIEAGAQA